MSAAVAMAQPAAYFDKELQTHVIKLLPADYHVTGEPLALVTLLGSCVAACLFDPLVGVGGMLAMASPLFTPGWAVKPVLKLKRPLPRFVWYSVIWRRRTSTPNLMV